jgi:hypothetical protein
VPSINLPLTKRSDDSSSSLLFVKVNPLFYRGVEKSLSGASNKILHGKIEGPDSTTINMEEVNHE